jgi:hypothetical protein
MPARVKVAICACAALAFALAGARAAEPSTDPATGLRVQGDWELVRSNCIACHSTRLITQQRGTAASWLAMIRWMQAEQNLRVFEPEIEARIVRYLADNYPPEASRRRAALPAHLMPPNPYAPARAGSD